MKSQISYGHRYLIRRSTLKKRSVLYTLDGVVALVIALVTLMAILYTLKTISVSRWSDNRINELSMDYLTVLEKDYSLKHCIDTGDSTPLKEFMNTYLPDNICADMKIYDSSGVLLLVETKTGCYSGDRIYMTKRSFVTNNLFYYAAMEAWYNG